MCTLQFVCLQNALKISACVIWDISLDVLLTLVSENRSNTWPEVWLWEGGMRCLSLARFLARNLGFLHMSCVAARYLVIIVCYEGTTGENVTFMGSEGSAAAMNPTNVAWMRVKGDDERRLMNSIGNESLVFGHLLARCRRDIARDLEAALL